jgi:hypothetical protein
VQRVVAYVFLFIELVRRSLISGGLGLKSDPAERPGGEVGGPSSAGELGGGNTENSPGGLPTDRPIVLLRADILRQAETFPIVQAQQQVKENMRSGKNDALLPRI